MEAGDAVVGEIGRQGGLIMGAIEVRGWRFSAIWRASLFVRFAVVVAIAVALLLGPSAPALAETGSVPLPPGCTDGWTWVVEGGFTDPSNSHIAFSTEFKGYLYVATMASQASELISGSQKMGGDIWRTADGSTWEQIGTAGLGDPLNIMFDLVVETWVQI